MRTRTRITATAATGLFATVLMASPGLAASASAARGTGPQVGVCDGTGDRLQARDHVSVPGTPIYLKTRDKLQIHKL